MARTKQYARSQQWRQTALGQRRYRARNTNLPKYTRRTNYPNLRAQLAQRGLGQGKINYVDGYLDVTAVHNLDGAADDTWGDCELNPRQQTAVYGCLPVPRVGTGFADRNDRKIIIKNIRIKGYVRWPAANTITAGTGNSYVRIIIVKDTRTNGVALNAEDVIGAGQGSDGQAVLSGDGGAINFLSKPEGWGRYHILKDFILKAPPQPVSWDGTDVLQQQLVTNFAFKVKGCPVNFLGNTGAVGSIIDNSYHFLAAHASGVGDASISYTARTAFYDD